MTDEVRPDLRTQWAAVSTYWERIRVPAQPLESLTTQGNSPRPARPPPTTSISRVVWPGVGVGDARHRRTTGSTPSPHSPHGDGCYRHSIVLITWLQLHGAELRNLAFRATGTCSAALARPKRGMLP